MQFLYRLVRIAIIFFLLLGITSMFFLGLVDDTPYRQQDYYEKTLGGFDLISEKDLKSSGDSLLVGWAKKSLLPKYKTPLAGFSKREGAQYESVLDSVWAKTIIFDNNSKQLLYISLDLLIVPPEVTMQLSDALDSMGFDKNNTFISATHTHSSIGSWAQGQGGELFAGEYNPLVVAFIVRSIAESTYQASLHKKPARLGYSAVQAGDQVTNRLVGDAMGTIDPWLRFLKIEQQHGQTAILSTYSAHATCMPYHSLQVSGDYPGALCRKLEEAENIDFAVFSAGGMASMAPLSSRTQGTLQVEDMASNLSEQVRLVQNFTPVHYDSILGGVQIPLYMGNPQWRITEGIRVRPWIFREVFGESPSYISSARIGNVLFIGVPCDFSGELVSNIEKYARKLGIHVIITSFNGGYHGYITKDEWYPLDKYETRMMNWYGPHNGAYYTEIIKTLIDKYHESY